MRSVPMHLCETYQFFQSSLLRFWNEEEDHHKRRHVQCGIEAECTSDGESGDHAWEGER